jgi:hypothetical protein
MDVYQANVGAVQLYHASQTFAMYDCGIWLTIALYVRLTYAVLTYSTSS